MLNVGLTQKPSAIASHLKNPPFVLKMLLANFVFAPLLMAVALYFAPFPPALKAGLLIFSVGAGVPFLIKRLGTAQRNTAAGVIVAIQNFPDPNVFVMLTLANILGIVMLLFIAKALSRDNKVKVEAV